HRTSSSSAAPPRTRRRCRRTTASSAAGRRAVRRTTSRARARRPATATNASSRREPPSRAARSSRRGRSASGTLPVVAVRELRLVVTAADYEAALRFYRDVVGLPVQAVFASPGGHVTLLDAGRATLELMDDANAE